MHRVDFLDSPQMSIATQPSPDVRYDVDVPGVGSELLELNMIHGGVFGFSAVIPALCSSDGSGAVVMHEHVWTLCDCDEHADGHPAVPAQQCTVLHPSSSAL